jgi:hypothetical protein
MVAYLNKKITVVGITSWGIGCANGINPGCAIIIKKKFSAMFNFHPQF